MPSANLNAWHWDPPPPSAKARIDAAVNRNRLASAQQVIQAQDQELAQLRSRLATDARPKKNRVLKPVLPSHALECEYRNKIECLIDDMQRSVLYWLKAAFKANEPEVAVLAQDSMSSLSRGGVEGRHAAVEVHEQAGINERPRLPSAGVAPGPRDLAQDALPATALRKVIRKLSRRWQRDFNEASWNLAKWFTLRVHQRSNKTLHKILKDGGWTVEFKMSAAQRDIIHATVNENVSLIKSIPQHYFTQVEGMVMRSVQTGRDLQQLTNDLQRNYKVTRKRAELIARDQSNKANASLVRARQIELGIERAIWVHSGAGKHPRPTHVKQNGKEYDPVRGWWDPAVRRYIFPGSEINCRCFSRSLVPGFS